MKQEKTILIAVTGMTPQVVTETLYALLVQRNEIIDEVDILTTAEGKNRLIQSNLPKQITDLCSMYQKKCPVFDLSKNVWVAQEETMELPDIRTDRENVLFPNMIVDLIREKTSEGSTRLHCSIAGGRKTMSVAMAFALSLFGKKNDTLSHVLVSKSFEQSGKFYPESGEEEKMITLSEVPFIRLRKKLPLLKEHPKASYSDLVSIAQEVIKHIIILPSLTVERKLRSIVMNNRRIVFPPFEFALYCFFLKRKHFVRGGKQFRREDSQDLWKLYEQYAPSVGQLERAKQTIWKGNTIEFSSILKGIAQIKRRFRLACPNELMLDHYIISVKGNYGIKEYGILLNKSRILWR